MILPQLQQRCAADTEAAKAAATAAGAERAQAQEQLAYLRGQLQLVLQESDRELGLLQEQLAGSREEAEALRGAVAAASGRQQQQTELMNELTQSLAQHKAQLQVGQKGVGPAILEVAIGGNPYQPTTCAALHDFMWMDRQQAALACLYHHASTSAHPKPATTCPCSGIVQFLVCTRHVNCSPSYCVLPTTCCRLLLQTTCGYRSSWHGARLQSLTACTTSSSWPRGLRGRCRACSGSWRRSRRCGRQQKGSWQMCRYAWGAASVARPPQSALPLLHGTTHTAEIQ